jgi:hypothetical protein
MLLVSGIQGTQDDLFNLVRGDFTGTQSFIYWLAAIAIVGGVGYIPGLRNFSHAFLVLILIVLIIGEQNKKNIFQQITSALGATTANVGPVNTNAQSGGQSDLSKATDALKQTSQIAATAAAFA